MLDNSVLLVYTETRQQTIKGEENMNVVDMSGFVRSILKVVESHYLGNGAYCRWLWQDEMGRRRLGVNEYGCADAANILYTIDEFVCSEEERAARISALRSMQDPETGMFT